MRKEPRCMEVKRQFGASKNNDGGFDRYVSIDVTLSIFFEGVGGMEEAERWEAQLKRMMRPVEEAVAQ